MSPKNNEYCLEWYKKRILVLGCGNILFGDDGFGPAVADYLLNNFKIPEYACVINAGTSENEILFDISLSDEKPRQIIIVDSVKRNKKPGEVFNLSIDELLLKKTYDFSFHLGPTADLLKGLRDQCRVDIIILACEPENIPDAVKPGLSRTIQEIVPKVSQLICDIYLK
jgi:coenzyme F420 hydrogenase subunit delta